MLIPFHFKTQINVHASPYPIRNQWSYLNMHAAQKYMSCLSLPLCCSLAIRKHGAIHRSNEWTVADRFVWNWHDARLHQRPFSCQLYTTHLCLQCSECFSSLNRVVGGWGALLQLLHNHTSDLWMFQTENGSYCGCTCAHTVFLCLSEGNHAMTIVPLPSVSNHCLFLSPPHPFPTFSLSCCYLADAWESLCLSGHIFWMG